MATETRLLGWILTVQPDGLVGGYPSYSVDRVLLIMPDGGAVRTDGAPVRVVQMAIAMWEAACRAPLSDRVAQLFADWDANPLDDEDDAILAEAIASLRASREAEARG